jgi:hypothetical protein
MPILFHEGRFPIVAMKVVADMRRKDIAGKGHDGLSVPRQPGLAHAGKGQSKFRGFVAQDAAPT